MRVSVRLHAVLRDLIEGGVGEIELAEGATITALLDQLGVDAELRELVTLNGEQVSDFDNTKLADGDKLEVFPAVAGGRRSPYIDEAVRLYSEGDYFMTHEVLEEHWLDVAEDERDFLQGLIHLAVGLHHHFRGNDKGARSQFHKGFRRLQSYPDVHHGIDVAAVRAFLGSAPKKLDEGESLEVPILS
jgi:hypothetical protein